jgi:hypothetical protein
VRPERLGVEPDERVIAIAKVSFRGAAAATARATVAMGSARTRQKAFEEWAQAARSGGFPTAGPEMTLCLTDRRLIVCRHTFWMNRPDGAAGSTDLSRFVEVAIVRHGLLTSIALAIESVGLVEVEAYRGRPLRRLARALRAQIAERAP